MADIRALLNSTQHREDDVPPTDTRKRSSPYVEPLDLSSKRFCVSPTEHTPSPVLLTPPAQPSQQIASPVTPVHREPVPTIPPSPLPPAADKPSAENDIAPPPTPVFIKPPSPRTLGDGGADRFARSRIVGQTHRDKERKLYDSMDSDVSSLAQDHDILHSLLALRDVGQEDRGRELEPILVRQGRLGNPCIHALSPRCSSVLGRSFLPGSLAGMLLEIVAARRNLIGSYGDERRRRPSYLMPSSQSALIAAVTHGCACIAAEVEGNKNIAAEAAVVGAKAKKFITPTQKWMQLCLFGLAETYEKWAQFESQNDAADPEDHLERSEAAEDAAKTGRGKGAKRCSRCNKLKTAGSGHGRSKCDDHELISSSKPYPFIPQ